MRPGWELRQICLTCKLCRPVRRTMIGVCKITWKEELLNHVCHGAGVWDMAERCEQCVRNRECHVSFDCGYNLQCWRRSKVKTEGVAK